jgi:hypothetical protein
VIRNKFGRFQRNPAEMFVDLLERAQNQFLRFLVVLIRKVRKHFPNDIEINLTVGGSVGFRVWHVRLLPAIHLHGKLRN